MKHDTKLVIIFLMNAVALVGLFIFCYVLSNSESATPADEKVESGFPSNALTQEEEDIGEFEIKLSEEELDSINESAIPDSKYYTDKEFERIIATNSGNFFDPHSATLDINMMPYTFVFRNKKGGIVGTILVDEKGLTCTIPVENGITIPDWMRITQMYDNKGNKITTLNIGKNSLTFEIPFDKKPTTHIHYNVKD